MRTIFDGLVEELRAWHLFEQPDGNSPRRELAGLPGLGRGYGGSAGPHDGAPEAGAPEFGRSAVWPRRRLRPGPAVRLGSGHGGAVAGRPALTAAGVNGGRRISRGSKRYQPSRPPTAGLAYERIPDAPPVTPVSALPDHLGPDPGSVAEQDLRLAVLGDRRTGHGVGLHGPLQRRLPRRISKHAGHSARDQSSAIWNRPTGGVAGLIRALPQAYSLSVRDAEDDHPPGPGLIVRATRLRPRGHVQVWLFGGVRPHLLPGHGGPR